jgi:hypothetical protein
MPCRSYDDDEPVRPQTYHGLTASELEAALCGILSSIESLTEHGELSVAAVLSSVDWQEAGVNRNKVSNWWREHKATDKLRREREARAVEEADRLARLRDGALAKLTPAEMIALGLNGK